LNKRRYKTTKSALVFLRPTNPNPVSALAAQHLVAVVGLRLDGPWRRRPDNLQKTRVDQ